MRTATVDSSPGRGGRAGQDGSVIVLAAITLPVLIAFVALVVDLGAAFLMDRHLQAGADAAALAAAQDLPNTTTADSTAHAYSSEPGGKNERSSLPDVTAVVTFPDGTKKVKVVQSAESPVFFASILGIDGIGVSASAVASRQSTTTGTPLAIYVHELCGASTGDKGLIINGQNALVEGGIHVNGHLEIGGQGFESVGRTTVYRPPPQGTSDEDSAHPQGSGCKTTDTSDSVYCTGCPTGSSDAPTHGDWRDWATPYHTEAIMKSHTPCTINHNNDVKYENTTIPSGVHCLPNDKKFTLAGNTTGTITVIGGIIEATGTSTLRPYDEDHPVLFYSTNTTGTPIVMNPSGEYDWVGYIINRFGGIQSDAQGVTSPFRGLLEAEWVSANGQDFRMLGTFPDEQSGSQGGAVSLDE